MHAKKDENYRKMVREIYLGLLAKDAAKPSDKDATRKYADAASFRDE